MTDQTTDQPTEQTDDQQGQPTGDEQQQRQPEQSDQAAQQDQSQANPTEQDEAEAESQQQQPVEYGEFKVAEGVTLDEDALGEFKSLAADANLNQDQAQKVVDIGVKLQQKWAADQTKAMTAAREQWAQSSNADKEFGGEKLSENLSVAKKALDKFGTPELKQLLNDSGLGSHPEVVRFFFRAGKAISDDRFVGGGNGPGPNIDPADVLFPTMKKGA